MSKYSTYCGWAVSPIEMEVMNQESKYFYMKHFHKLCGNPYTPIVFGEKVAAPIPPDHYEAFCAKWLPRLAQCGKQGWDGIRLPLYYINNEEKEYED